MHVLEGLAGVAAGRCIPIPTGGLTVGKRPDNDLCLVDNFVSRAHARFELEGDTLWLTDLGSTNGTLVNDLQVQRRRLRAGDQIQIGGSLFRYRDRPTAVLQGEPAAAGAIEPTVVRTMRAPPPPAAATPSSSSGDGALAELARLRPGALSPEAALGRILELVFQVLPVDRGCVVLLDEAGTPVPGAVRYRDPGQAREDVPLSRTLLQRAVESGSALLITDTALDPGLAAAASILAHRLRCVAYLPLLFGEEAIGALCLDTQVPGGLREAHLDTLVAFANQAAIVAYQARLQQRIRAEMEKRERLQRFVAASVVEQYLAEGVEPVLGGEEREVTVLFADLRGYTSLAEKIPPREAVALLNTLFERLGEPVAARGGTLDKYIGDCLMVLFGAPFGHEGHCLRAVRTALDMQAEMETATSDLAAKYGGLAIGIAINTGTAVVGNIGSEVRMDYTAIGDVVNVAARVEDLAGPGQILVTEAVAREVASAVHLQPATTLTLRGREQPTAVYAVHGLRPDAGG
jgi:adenylate cyclase